MHGKHDTFILCYTGNCTECVARYEFTKYSSSSKLTKIPRSGKSAIQLHVQYHSDARYNERAFAFACNRVCVRVQPRLHSHATAFVSACKRVRLSSRTHSPPPTNAFASPQSRFALSRTHSPTLTVNRGARCRVETPFYERP